MFSVSLQEGGSREHLGKRQNMHFPCNIQVDRQIWGEAGWTQARVSEYNDLTGNS